MADFLDNTERKDDVEMMSDANLKRLIEWMKNHGHTDEEIVELLDFMTGK